MNTKDTPNFQLPTPSEWELKLIDKKIKQHYRRKVYQCDNCLEIFIRVKHPTSCKCCGKHNFTQVADKLACYAID